MAKKVLIITYYWPPSGGAGVQRWLKFVKYLNNFGWEPIIYTPSNAEMPIEDASLLKDIPDNTQVIQRPIWEPYSFYKSFVGQKKDVKINTGFLTENKKPTFAENISVWIRGNLFIPDARRFWIRPSVSYLSQYLLENPVDAIVSTGPPHSMHLIARGLQQKLGLPWLADFRDPWTKIDFYKDLKLTAWADRQHHKLEKTVLLHANSIITVSPTLTRELQETAVSPSFKKSVPNQQFKTITNGFDPDDTASEQVQLDQCFSIAHIGTMVRSRNPLVLWQALSELIKEVAGFSSHIQIKLVGKVDLQVTESLAKFGLTPFVSRIDYLPHNQISKVQRESQLLLLIINDTPNAKGILTGKLFEYLSSQRPIVAIGPKDGDAANVLTQTQAGQTFPFDQQEGLPALKADLLRAFNQYLNHTLSIVSQNTAVYSRRELTRELANELNRITSKY